MQRGLRLHELAMRVKQRLKDLNFDSEPLQVRRGDQL